MDAHVDLGSVPIADLLAGYGRTLAELRRRGVLRTNNPPAGDYAEWLVQRALGGSLAPNSEKSHDVTLEDSRTVQVKARVVSAPPAAGQLQTSPFRSWNFDLAAFVLLDSVDYRPTLGVLVPVEITRQHAKARPHVNGEVVFIRPPLTTAEGTIDITAQLAAAAVAVADPYASKDGELLVTDDNDECIHLLRPNECSICRAQSSPTPPATQRQREASAPVADLSPAPTDDELDDFYTWLQTRKVPTIGRAAASDYRSRVRRYARGDLAGLDAKGWASIDTAVRTFIEYRHRRNQRNG